MNRFVSNFILSFFVLALMAVYGFSKQPTIYSAYMASKNTPVMHQGLNQVKLPNGEVVKVWVAQDPESRKKGLAIADTLNADQGMLFVFDQSGPQPIWMKDMKFPIDIMWLDDQGQVVEIARDVPVEAPGADLPIYTNSSPAKYVLEVKAGLTEEAGVQVGDKLDLS